MELSNKTASDNKRPVEFGPGVVENMSHFSTEKKHARWVNAKQI